MKHISREQEVEQALSKLLRLSLEPLNIADQLKEALKILTSISWLNLHPKGAIFLTGSKDNLVMIAHHNLEQKLIDKCEELKIGECLCGQSAQQKKILFRNCISEEHSIHYDGMKEHGHYNIPLISNDQLLGIIVLYLPHGYKPKENEITFIEMIRDVVSSIVVKRMFEERAKISQHELEESQAEVIARLLSAAEYRDREVGIHIKRMTQYSLLIGKRKGLTKHQLHLLELGAPMHDIGKIGIPDSILLKEGLLFDDETDVMKQHTFIGSKILQGHTEHLKAASEIALSHHEKWDGSGYPLGLKGSEIPLFGRICAIADVFDALTTRRPYKEAWSLEKAFDFIMEQSGRYFDPELTEIFLSSKEDIKRFYVLYSDNIIDPDKQLTISDQPQTEGRVQWSSDLSIEIDSIDEHHKYLIGLLNEIHHSIAFGDGVIDVVGAINKMKEYADIHFAEEEKLMKHYDCLFLDKHIELHKQFISRCNDFQQNMKEHPLSSSIEIVRFLEEWLISHIKYEDGRIRECSEGMTSN